MRKQITIDYNDLFQMLKFTLFLTFWRPSRLAYRIVDFKVPNSRRWREKKYPLYSDYMKYFQKTLSTIFELHEVLPKKLSTIFRLHEVLPKTIIHNTPIAWSTSNIKLSTIFRLHEVLPKTNYPLYSDYMKYFQYKIIHYIPITWSTSKKIIHNIPITWSTS